MNALSFLAWLQIARLSTEIFRFIDAEVKKWAPVVKASGAKPD
jgi:hypothetical protein